MLQSLRGMIPGVIIENKRNSLQGACKTLQVHSIKVEFIDNVQPDWLARYLILFGYDSCTL